MVDWIKVSIVMCAVIVAAEAKALAVSYAYAFSAANYLVAPSTTVNVDVYLEEAIGSGETSVLSSTGVGLFGAGVRLRFNVAPQPTDPAKVLTTLDIAANSAFDDLLTTAVADGYATLAENTTSIIDFVHGLQPDSSKEEYRLLIGTFAFTAGATPGETTPILATRYGDTASVVVTGDGVVLDGLIAPRMAAITTIPEPNTVVLAAAAAIGLLACIWRRRR